MPDFVRVDNRNEEIIYLNRTFITNIVYDPKTDKTFIWMVGDKADEYTAIFGDVTSQIVK